jgi:hypothetical protein
MGYTGSLHMRLVRPRNKGRVRDSTADLPQAMVAISTRACVAALLFDWRMREQSARRMVCLFRINRG